MRVVVVALVLLGLLTGCGQAPPDVAGLRPFPAAAPERTTTSSRVSTTSIDLSALSTTDPHSIWVVINKTHPIRPKNFRPKLAPVRGYRVARPVAAPLERMLRAGDRAGMGLRIQSAFRSYAYQVHVHAQLVASKGQDRADETSARPGFSEHQAGLAVDLVTPGDPSCDFKQCFAKKPGGRWLAEHAWEYGFIVRYTVGNQSVTGYSPEPWHLRYVGKPLAKVIHDEGTTLEDLFDISGGDYR